ncbi:hypothetical protein HFP15_41180 [Amycolatopsis sp. K13G38]|uniref:Uncharacterized protein n=1 Tax=Amycolatopsis acididurans TaxID=2724524 RepID=A0ABX1JK32_9PSEU|nr:hypothetical protein [Amycolatopsis acididurans]
MPVLVVVLSLVVGGGLLAREVYRAPEVRLDTVLGLPASSARPLGEQPGPGTVELTPDAAQHPQHDVVERLLQTYFDAINTRDYDQWKVTVTRDRIQAKPRPAWLNDYKTTKDGSILVYRIDAVAEADMRVLLGFTSTQDASDAPDELPGASCVHWRLSLPLTKESGNWKVDTVAGYAPPEVDAC